MVILNTILIPINPETFILGGTAGAAIGTTICHLIAFLIDISIMNKYIKLKVNVKDYIIKPILATFMMSICSLFIYHRLIGIIYEKLCTIVSILIAVILYVVLVFLLKVFSEDNIFMLPYGQKIHKILKSIGIYGKWQKRKNKNQ